MVKRLVIGLGNPGKDYRGTRHNFGARVVARLIHLVGRNELRERGIACLLPTVNMNESGQAVAEFLRQTPLEGADILLVHDDLELPLGEWKFQTAGSAKGHNGVRSVQAVLGTQEIPRLRLGIGHPGSEKNVSDYVLEQFLAEEKLLAERVIQEAAAALSQTLIS